MAVQERGIRTRNELIRAAAIVFDAHGFTGGSTSMILKATDGVVQGSLYFHFPTKRHIASAVLEESTQLVLGAIEVIKTHSASALEALIDISARYGQLLVEDVTARAGFRLAIEPSAISDESRTAMAAVLTEIDALVARAKGEGDLRPEAAGHFATTLVAAFIGIQQLDEVQSHRANSLARLGEVWQLLVPAAVPADRADRYLAKAATAFAS